MDFITNTVEIYIDAEIIRPVLGAIVLVVLFKGLIQIGLRMTK